MARKVFHPAVEDFLAYLDIERNASPGTIAGYRDDLTLFLRFLGNQMGVDAKGVDLDLVRRSDITKYLAYLKNERDNAPRTINRKLSAIRSLYYYLNESDEWRVNSNPVSEMSSLRKSKLLPVYLSLEEVELLLNSIPSTSRFPERDYAIFMLFVQCGCRFSELLSLTVDSVDLSEWTLRIFGKGRKERIVPLGERAVDALQAYLNVRQPRVGTRILFLNNKHRPLQADGLRYIFRSVIERSPLEKKGLTPHKLRHTCLTLLRQAGVDMRTLQEIAGHSSISTTQIYAHVSRDEIKREMDKHPLG